MKIKCEYNYAKIKILSSLFSKKGKRSLRVLIFKTLTEKATYDRYFLAPQRKTNSNYSSKYIGGKYIDQTEKYIMKSPYLVPLMVKGIEFNKKPIFLTYYLKKE